MADISVLARLLNGAMRNVDLTNNTPVVLSIKIGGGTNTELTKAILDRLVSLQNGSDVDATYHTHDGRYYTETELSDAVGPATGSDLIGDDDSYSNFTPSAATVKGALEGIDSALAATADEKVGITAADTTPGYLAAKIQVDIGSNTTDALEESILSPGGDETLRIRFDASKVDHGALVGLGDDDHTIYTKADGTRAFTGNQSFGGFQATNLADPTTPQAAATKAYVDARDAGLKPKEATRVSTQGNVDLATALEDGDIIDGVTLATGDRVLVRAQTASEDNGIYVVQASGAAVRATDFDSLTPVDEINRAWVPVQEGTDAGKVFVQYGVVATLDTDPIDFTFYDPITALIGGDMITKTGSTFSVDLLTNGGLKSSNPGNAGGQLQVSLEASNPTLEVNGSNELKAKLDAAGAIVSGASGLNVAVDDSTIEKNANALRVKAAGITESHLAASVAGAGLSGGAGTPLAVNVDDSTIEINSDTLRAKDAGITAAKLNTNVADQVSITGGAGSALAVQSAPLARRTLVAGESFAANTSFLVRWALTGETAGRVYKADKDASSTAKYMAIGIALSTGAVSAGQNITVIMLGEHTLGSSDTPFASGDVGKELFVGTTGAFILGSALANTTNEAQFCVGVVQETSKIWIDAKQLRGIA